MKKILATLTITGLILPAVTVSASAAEYHSNGQVEFIPNTDPIPPVDPEDPDPTNPVDPIDPTDPEGPEPGTDGPLSLDYASSLDFGVNKISNKTETYYAKAQQYTDKTEPTANYVQVTDNRGTNAGWILKVKQDGEFTSTTETVNDILSGAKLTLANGTPNSISTSVAPIATKPIVLTAGAESTVMQAAEGAGSGTWVNYWGTSEAITEEDEEGNSVVTEYLNKDISLEVPGATPKDSVVYKTKLVWTLSSVPGQ